MMLPSVGKHAAAASMEEQEERRRSPQKSKKQDIKSTLKSHFSSHFCAWLTAILLLQLFIILFLNIPSSPPPPAPPYTLPSFSQRRRFEGPVRPHDDDGCKYGRIYVYDLPPMFNKGLLDNCHDIDPFSSRCVAVSNGGFGPPADGLDDVVPRNLTPAWYWTDMYAAEVIYHGRMMDYSCRTTNQELATAFYIPFYAGLAVGKYLWFNYTSKDRDFHSEAMLNWVKDQSPWKKSNGLDHFIMLGRLTWDFRRLTDNDSDWGTKFMLMPLMKNVLRLSVEKSPWDALEVSVPYPTSFHPRSESDVYIWQSFIRARKRSSLYSFVGATRKKIKNDFRGVLMDYCKSEPITCGVVDCSVTHCYDGAPGILEMFLDSSFCLQPKGDGSTRRSMFDCMLAGAIPVYFWKGSFEYQYEWHLPNAAESYSVFIDHNDVRNKSTIIKQVLERYSEEEVERMREKIIDFIPRFLYLKSSVNLGGFKDAFDIAMEGVLTRIRKQKTGV